MQIEKTLRLQTYMDKIDIIKFDLGSHDCFKKARTKHCCKKLVFLTLASNAKLTCFLLTMKHVNIYIYRERENHDACENSRWETKDTTPCLMFLIFEARKHNNPIYMFISDASKRKKKTTTGEQEAKCINIWTSTFATPPLLTQLISLVKSKSKSFHKSCHQMKQHNRMTVTSLRVAIEQIKLSANNTNHVRKRLKVSSMSRCHDLRCQLLRTVPATVQINTLRNPKIKFRRVFLPKVLGPRR